MARNYRTTLFNDDVQRLQEIHGSRASYAKLDAGADGAPDLLTAKEIDYIALRDSFYMASVTADGWPYMQHRGGPAGFLRHIEGNRIGFADYRGNKQYISTANLMRDDRVSLFLMDYPNRERLKLLGHAKSIERDDDPELVASLMPGGYRAVPERAFLIDVIGWEWNCSQHITPRFTEAEISAAIKPMAAELGQLRAELAALRAEKDKT
ncbi:MULTISPECIES: pyridoxamine 5'-phosphate oxidase family protein [unclassified Sphingopyxis]|uniref:pyridoxamine 5'-phosphate oxidase family protein n=1 Tax=unclassified Sphingopyxis TaxID=2614943 RepID=UPI000736F3C5|nr:MULTISPECIES: pyridoxamine 5'-phosphate oxidase family protein [unclassified Sphingopyxis]KTE37484.1 pyridoxamine 5'-phosphate oxidase [Sphingopyxis sp. HIX]KTE79447.1 pyridoxamine 5'-phosphate oxidase [Sphingopyxis sp. HXXIV]